MREGEVYKASAFCMIVFELVIGLLFVGALLSLVARRARVPYPALLALAGAGLALVPDVPSVVLDPELALALFVAPVLLDAAFDSSPRDLKENWRQITGLALLAVGFTVVAVAVVARAFEPGLSWAAAIALGAIVAPPDAAAATAVLKQLRLPHRLLVVLEGESLFNDASALLIYRLAVAAATGAVFSPWSALPVLLASSLGSVLLGLALAWVAERMFGRIKEVGTAVLVQFLTTFAIWILAERLHLSGIITIVVFGITVARTAGVTPARLRVPSFAVWEVTVFVLNVLAFILVGLQLKPIVQDLSAGQLARYASGAAAVCAAVILVRVLWVGVYEAGARLLRQVTRFERPARHPSPRAALLVAWCGMRGTVTLAAALALPVGSAGQAGFPHRDFILFTAFCVVLVTLVVQGMTLTPLMRVLALDDDGALGHELTVGRQTVARAGLAALQDSESVDDEADVLRRKYELRVRRLELDPDQSEARAEGGAEPDPLHRALTAERRALIELRTRGVIGDDAYHKIEEELDWAELHADAR
ncbi:MAG: Na+/H+ antiporter [Polyangiaceae bacterium]